jgi:hypothetical protein
MNPPVLNNVYIDTGYLVFEVNGVQTVFLKEPVQVKKTTTNVNNTGVRTETWKLYPSLERIKLDTNADEPIKCLIIMKNGSEIQFDTMTLDIAGLIDLSLEDYPEPPTNNINAGTMALDGGKRHRKTHRRRYHK